MFFDFLMDNEKWKWNRKLKIERKTFFYYSTHLDHLKDFNYLQYHMNYEQGPSAGESHYC
jgi:hypothetical protein